MKFCSASTRELICFCLVKVDENDDLIIVNLSVF